MDAELKLLVEQNRTKLATAIAELTALRENLPEAKKPAIDRTIQRLGQALAGDTLYLSKNTPPTDSVGHMVSAPSLMVGGAY